MNPRVFRRDRRCRFGLAMIVTVSCFAGLSAVVGWAHAPAALDDRQQAQMLAAHNRWRASAGVTPLRWSPALARRAQSWASRLAREGCDMRHSRAPDVGENIFYASARRSGGRRQIQAITPRTVVDAWARERADYSHARNRCAPGKVCGHYTQVVWSGTREVGCGQAVCADMGQIWVCNYQPPGNIVGRRPY